MQPSTATECMYCSHRVLWSPKLELGRFCPQRRDRVVAYHAPVPLEPKGHQRRRLYECHDTYVRRKSLLLCTRPTRAPDAQESSGLCGEIASGWSYAAETADEPLPGAVGGGKRGIQIAVLDAIGEKLASCDRHHLVEIPELGGVPR